MRVLIIKPTESLGFRISFGSFHRSVFLIICLFFIWTLLLFDVVQAEEKELKLEKILVAAPKKELKSTVTERVPNLTSKVKVTAEEIETYNAVNIEDTVRYLPNL